MIPAHKKDPAIQPAPTNHGGRPSPEESEQISARILDAARTLFLRDGYGNTSMDAIAAEIGISKRTLYARHAGKAELFETMIVDVFTTSTSQIEMDDLSDKPVREALTTLAERILAVTTAPLFISLERTVIGESRQFSKLAELTYEHTKKRFQEEVIEILRRSNAHDSDLDLDAEIFLAIVTLPASRKAVLQRATPGLHGVDHPFLERTIDIFLQGMGHGR